MSAQLRGSRRFSSIPHRLEARAAAQVEFVDSPGRPAPRGMPVAASADGRERTESAHGGTPPQSTLEVRSWIMIKSLPVFVLACVSAVAVGGRSVAADWYVDAVNGSNANSGTSASAAWRSLTWAVAHAPAGQGDTIHIAAGLYDAALGESFPIHVRSEQRLVGVERDSVIVDGGGSGLLLFGFISHTLSDSFTSQSGLERMSLRHADAGVALHSL